MPILKQYQRTKQNPHVDFRTHDRATLRSVERSRKRAAAGRWDGMSVLWTNEMGERVWWSYRGVGGG